MFDSCRAHSSAFTGGRRELSPLDGQNGVRRPPARGQREAHVHRRRAARHADEQHPEATQVERSTSAGPITRRSNDVRTPTVIVTSRVDEPAPAPGVARSVMPTGAPPVGGASVAALSVRVVSPPGTGFGVMVAVRPAGRGW